MSLLKKKSAKKWAEKKVEKKVEKVEVEEVVEELEEKKLVGSAGLAQKIRELMRK
jgi:hypothetical protein